MHRPTIMPSATSAKITSPIHIRSVMLQPHGLTTANCRSEILLSTGGGTRDGRDARAADRALPAHDLRGIACERSQTAGRLYEAAGLGCRWSCDLGAECRGGGVRRCVFEVIGSYMERNREK